MKKFKDLRNMKFGNLTVLNEPPIRKNNQTYWQCKCICGNIKYFFQGNLIRGMSKSCGCLIYFNRKHRKTKNYSDEKLTKTLARMKQRCYNPKNISYKNYGARGIRICKEWLENSENFYKWAKENGYNPNLNAFECTIDRIDVNGDYSPTNCRWVSMNVQSNNKRNNRLITINDITKTASQWAKEYNVTHEGFIYKYKHNLL